MKPEISITFEIKPQFILVTFFDGRYIKTEKFIGYSLKEVKQLVKGRKINEKRQIKTIG